MLNLQTSKKQGFTIIEVVLVLAVAGLIFLMIFLALPALQRAQRDNGRKRSVGLVAAAIKSWSANNKGKSLMDFAEGFKNSYAEDEDIKDIGADPRGWLQAVDAGILDGYLSLNKNQNSTSSNILPKEIEAVKIYLGIKVKHIKFVLNREQRGENKFGTIYIMVGVKCPEDSTVKAGKKYQYVYYPKASRGNASITAFMENGGYYCQDI